jgi:hypothetical protein
VEKYGTARQVTHDNIIRRMCITCWITRATDTHSEYVTLLFQGNNSDTKAPQCYDSLSYSICHTDGDVSIKLLPIQNGSTNYFKAVSAATNWPLRTKITYTYVSMKDKLTDPSNVRQDMHCKSLFDS